MSAPEPHEPVTVSIARKVLPGREAAYEEWIKGIATAAASFPGHQGLNVLRPSARTHHEYVLIYRFDTYEHGRAWEESDERARWLEKLADITAGETKMKKVTGLEFWFDLPGVPAAAKAPQWKMALVLIAVVFVLVYPLQLTVGQWLSGGPFWFRVLAIVVLQVLLMTYLVMPRVTALLKGWLFKPAK